MSYLELNKTELINLEYSLGIEYLRSNRAGSFSSSTIINCHTRKYHGLLVCPLEEFNGESHVLLSALDETVIQHDKEFHLAIRKYPKIFHPGHKYIRDFSAEPIPTVTFRVGGVILKKEMLLAQEEEQVLIKYTLEDAHSPTTIRLHPFLAFRNVHALTRSNLNATTKYIPVKNGIKTRMYANFPYLNMQTSKKTEYISAPDWFYNVEYLREKERGYNFQEDLYVPGYFEFDMKKGESIIFAGGLKEAKPLGLKRKFESEIKKRIPRDGYFNCLLNSAEQFIVKKGNTTEIISGFPWFGSWSRDTFIALPGLTLSNGDVKTCKGVLDTMTADLSGSLFKRSGNIYRSDDSSADAPLWYFWAIQKYAEKVSPEIIWRDYSSAMKNILNGYKHGTDFNIKMHENGLIYAGQEEMAVTWMDAVVKGEAVTPRNGYAVEINALWYNAVNFALEMAEKNNDKEFIAQWEELPERIKISFNDTFRADHKDYLADYVNAEYVDWAVRPNQIIAASMPYSPIEDEVKKQIIDVIESELLTPRGLRSLSPKHPDYMSACIGTQQERDIAYHNGSAWPWLMGHFSEAYLRLHEKAGVHKIEKLFYGFEDEMIKDGIGTLSELYDGNPPHYGREAISQAISIAEIIRMKNLIDKYK